MRVRYLLRTICFESTPTINICRSYGTQERVVYHISINIASLRGLKKGPKYLFNLHEDGATYIVT